MNFDYIDLLTEKDLLEFINSVNIKADGVLISYECYDELGNKQLSVIGFNGHSSVKTFVISAYSASCLYMNLDNEIRSFMAKKFSIPYITAAYNHDLMVADKRKEMLIASLNETPSR